MPSIDLTPYYQPQGSTSDGTKFDNGLAAIQSALNALDDANISATANIQLSKLATNPLGKPLALTGASAATRYVGATASGSPASGTFAVGDFSVDQTGKVFVCTVAGTPGTWVQVGAAAAATTYRKTTAKTVNTTVAETDLLNGEITIGAGVLGTTGILRLTAWGDWLQNSGASVAAFRFKLKLGATVLFDTGAPVTAVPSTTARGQWAFSARIANSAAAAQVADVGLEFTAGQVTTSFGAFAGALTTGEGNYSAFSNTASELCVARAAGYNTAAEDTTTAKALVLSVINPSASASCETKLAGALIEIL